MEETAEDKSDSIKESTASKVLENIQEEGIEIITKTKHVVIHSESSHVESSYVSTQPISMMEDHQLSSVAGDTVKEESGMKKVVRFDEKKEIVPSSDREESCESENKDQNLDSRIHLHELQAETADATTVVVSKAYDETETTCSREIDVENLESDLSESHVKAAELIEPVVETPRATEVPQEALLTITDESQRSTKEETEHVDENKDTGENEVPEKEDMPLEDVQPQMNAVDPVEQIAVVHEPIISSKRDLKFKTESDAQIQEEKIKAQLHEIINEIDMEVRKEESGPRPHTWKPKGIYKVPKTEVKFEEVVPIKVEDVKIEDRPKSEPPAEKEKKEVKKVFKVDIDHNYENYIADELSPHVKVLRHCLMNGEVLSPQEIPVGIPLLAKILPKENEEEHEKIPLERLFTPASDWEEIIPHHKKKAYASSCFYRPDHPTIDDQVELAHKISTSLVDETNKTSKGQTMYIKRKNRSAKWIHQGEEGEFEESAASQYDMEDDNEEEVRPQKEKPPLKLIVNQRAAQDQSQVQHHYEELLATSQTLQQISNMEVGMEIASDLQSPTGKGAALFAKRKKRMDKFIIDETTVQQQQQNVVHEETKSTTTTATASTTVNSYQASKFESKFSSQTQKQPGSLRLQNDLPAVTAQSVTNKESIQPGGLMLPDLANILTKPKPIEKKTPSLADRGISKKKPASRSHSADAAKANSGFQNKSFLQGQSAQGKGTVANQRIQNGPAGSFYNVSSYASHKVETSEQITNGICFEDPLANLRPGSPPTYLIPNGIEIVPEHQADSADVQSTNNTSTSEATTNNGIETIDNKALEHATNSDPSSLHLPIENQAESEASELANFSYFESPKQVLKPMFNLPQASPATQRSNQSFKLERPNSLPVIPLTNCSVSPSPSFYFASSNVQNANISQLKQTALRNSLDNQCSVNMSLLESENLNYVKPVSLVSVSNDIGYSKEILMNPVSVLSKVVDKPESPLIEPSWSDKIASLDSVPYKTINNFSVDELPQPSTFNNSKSTIKNSIIPNSEFQRFCPSNSYSSFNSFINYPKPFKSPTHEHSHSMDTFKTHILSTVKGDIDHKNVNRIDTPQSNIECKLISEIPARDEQTLISRPKLFTPDLETSNVLPDILDRDNFEFCEIQRSPSSIHKTDDLRQIIEELDNMIELDAKLYNNFVEEVNHSELANDFHALNASEEGEMLSNSFLAGDVEIKIQHGDSLVNEEELDNFISEIERSFSTTPTVLETISIQDLQPLEFYRSVSGSSLNDEEVCGESYLINNEDHKVFNETIDCTEESDGIILHYDENQIGSAEHSIQQNGFSDSPIICYTSSTLKDIHNEHNIANDTLHVTNTLQNSPLSLCVVSNKSPVNNLSTNTILTDTQTEGSTRHSDINLSPWSTESGTIYTAEVKVMQKSSPIPTSSIINFSAPAPQHSILSDLASVHEKDKRKSFNLAPKGWGTYNTYYTPVHLGAP